MRVPLISFAVAAVGAIASLGTGAWFDGGVSFLIGGWIGFDVVRAWGAFLQAVGLVVAFGSVGVRAFREDRGWDGFGFFTVPAVGLVFGGAWLFSLLQLGVWTEIEGDTHGRDLVVREWNFLLAGGGTVYERDGLLLTRLGDTRGDDGYVPFSRGEYSIRPDPDAVVLVFAFDHDGPRSQQFVIPDGAYPNLPDT